MRVEQDPLNLDNLFARLRQHEERVHLRAMDPHLPRRVEREISRGLHRPHARFAAAALVLILIGPLALRLRGRATPAQAGPMEARRLYEVAKGQKKGPWPKAVGAYRAVLKEAGRHDSLRPRSLQAIAGIYAKAGLPHAAQAARQSASRASRRSRRAPSSLLACARSLLSEGDLDAARPLLEEIAGLGGRRAPNEVASALRLLAEEAYDRQDRRRLLKLADRMDKEDLPYPLRIKTRSDLGLLHLEANARLLAQQALKTARTLYARCLEKADEKTARKATRLWLDLPLRAALPENRSAR